MNKRYFNTLLILSFIFASTTSLAASVPGEFIVKLKNNISVQNLDLISQKLNSYVKSEIPEDRLVVIQRASFELPESVISDFSSNPIVEYIEPNFIYHMNALPNDSLFDQQWGLKNSGQKDSEKHIGTPGIDIGAEQAWNITTGSDKVIVAVIDTGINLTHPDLQPNLWTNLAELNGKPGVDDDSNGYIDDTHGYNFENGKESPTPLDDVGHGSHCSGIIGGNGNNGQGIVGVNWQVKLMAVKFLNSAGEGTTEDSIKAIDYAVKNGAKIINASWGGDAFSKAQVEAIERANAAGVLFVAAAGNDKTNSDITPHYPSSYPVENIISVAAIDNQGRLARFSNFGKKSVHVGAPGVNIVSASNADFLSASGTSMAAPFVTGIAALLKAQEPLLTHLQIKDRIISTTEPMSGLQNKTLNRGLANAYRALTNKLTTPESEDPSNWKNETPITISSDHPYLNRTKQTFNVKVPGAKQFSLFFPKMAVEPGFDFIYVKDSTGKVVDKISGIGVDIYSAVIDGDSATVDFVSDRDIFQWGFDITKAVWR